MAAHARLLLRTAALRSPSRRAGAEDQDARAARARGGAVAARGGAPRRGPPGGEEQRGEALRAKPLCARVPGVKRAPGVREPGEPPAVKEHGGDEAPVFAALEE